MPLKYLIYSKKDLHSAIMNECPASDPPLIPLGFLLRGMRMIFLCLLDKKRALLARPAAVAVRRFKGDIFVLEFLRPTNAV
ncbi:hypothetical protein J2W51_003921 [Tardiphaga robiniae]|uniref:hypothetical protein n=1 Tax=Tardiphaga robiniae TaxID=943830 RepID=UPI00285EC16B|nr:hypothetical protein [Tardiphaga robiniae]MDR6661335.1 hypothetical protein [Tardiphaga robiniae]